MERYPRLIDGVRWLEESPGRYRLSHPDHPAELRMGRLEQLLLTALDGHTPPSEVVRNLALALGRPLSEGSLARVLQALAEQGLVELPARPTLEALPGGKVHCCRSGHCCHLAVGPLSGLERARLAALPWEERGEQPPATLFREQQGEFYLQQNAQDAACLFLEPSGSCRIHRVFGFEVKPAICRLFPLFTVETAPGVLRVGVSFDCPGSCQAEEGTPLSAAVAEAGELLYATSLRQGPPTLLGPRPDGAPPEPAAEAEGLELERDFLALLGGWPGTVEQALQECGTRLLEAAGDRLPEGVTLEEWLGDLDELAEQQLQRLASPYYRQRMERFRARLSRLAPVGQGGPRPPQAPPRPEVDQLLRRVWANYVFSRSQLFRFGQAAGLSLLLLLHGVLRQRLAEASPVEEPAPPLAAVGPWLAETLDGLRLVEPVQRFDGVGRRVLRGLLDSLTR